MVYYVLAIKAYKANVQYRMAHFINTVGSCIFSFVMMAIWTGVMSGKEALSPLSLHDVLFYLVLTQCMLWITTFLTPGLSIPEWVRTGQISLHIMKPVHFYFYTGSQEIGRIVYNFFHRFLPIYLILSCVVGFYVPTHFMTLVWFGLSALCAVGIGLNLYFMVGILAFWSTEVKWAHYFNQSLMLLLGGQMLPLDFFPRSFEMILSYLPYAGILYYPSMILLEKQAPQAIFIQLFWVILLTLFNIILTRFAQRRLEVQGG